MTARHKNLLLPLLTVLVIMLASCTHNDGDIGRQFGQWKLTRIERSGTVDTSYPGNIFWSFQNSTLEMKRVESDHSTQNTFANYRIADGTLFVEFPDDDRPPLDGLGLRRENAIQIVRLSHSEMVLSYDAADASPDDGTAADIILYFSKW